MFRFALIAATGLASFSLFSQTEKTSPESGDEAANVSSSTPQAPASPETGEKPRPAAEVPA